MSAEDIKAEIAAGHIGAIALDTTAFGNPSETSPEYGLLARLNQFRGTGVQFVLTDVVVHEVESHMADAANAAISQLEKSLKAIGGAWNVPRNKRIDAKQVLVREESPEAMARRRVQKFVDDTGCVVIRAEELATIGELVSRYFSNQPPFEAKETKKNEFPDALALLSLDTWAKRNDTKVLVVSSDDGWIAYCDSSPHLVVVQSLVEGLALFNANADVVCRALSLLLTSGVRTDWLTEIERAAQSHVDSIWFMAEADSMFRYDDEITDVSVVQVGIPDEGDILIPVEAEDGRVLAELTVSLELEVTCNFSFSLRDSIDKDYVNMGGTTMAVTDAIEVSMLISFGGATPQDFEIEDIEVEGEKRHSVDFGHVNPDWSDDADE